jgi:hypothetical protein
MSRPVGTVEGSEAKGRSMAEFPCYQAVARRVINGYTVTINKIDSQELTGGGCGRFSSEPRQPVYHWMFRR